MNDNDLKIAGAGTASAVTTAVGIGLMFLGPVGVVAGGIVLGAGSSGVVNTVVQATSGRAFEFGEWGINVGIGAAAGVVAAPFAAAGGAAASALTSTTAKVATHVAAQTVGSASASVVATSLHKVAAGESIEGRDIGRAAVGGAIIGGLTAGAGQAVGKGLAAVQKETIRAAVSKPAIAIRTVTTTTVSAASSAGANALAKVVDNAIARGCLTRAMFFELLHHQCNVPEEHVHELWTFLLNEQVIQDETVLREVPDNLEFPAEIRYLREATCVLIKTILRSDLSDGVGEAALFGALQAVPALLVNLGSNVQQATRVKSGLRTVSQGVKAGEPASSVEIEAHARATKQKVIVFEGERAAKKIKVTSARSFGSSSARTTKYVVLVDGHYYTADSEGQIAQPLNRVSTANNCFYEAVSAESALLVRAAVAKFIDLHPARLRVPVKELYWCELVGGAIYPEEVQKRIAEVKRDLAEGKMGKTFTNREGVLEIPDGQHTCEHDLPPGSSDKHPAPARGRGANRLVTLHKRDTNELVAAFTTEDHYKTFQKIDLDTGMPCSFEEGM